MQVVQGSCPAASSLGQAQCSGRVSDCWSVGQADADCINNALCCFDGCANVCQGAGNNAYPFYKVISFLSQALEPLQGLVMVFRYCLILSII